MSDRYETPCCVIGNLDTLAGERNLDHYGIMLIKNELDDWWRDIKGFPETYSLSRGSSILRCSRGTATLVRWQAQRRPGVNSVSLKVIYLWFMEEEDGAGSRKFLGSSAARRKELSVGHNGQLAISFTRRILRPFVPRPDPTKDRTMAVPSFIEKKISRVLRSMRFDSGQE